MKFHWNKVIGLGFGFDVIGVASNDLTRTRIETHCKVFLINLLVTFSFPLTRWAVHR